LACLSVAVSSAVPLPLALALVEFVTGRDSTGVASSSPLQLLSRLLAERLDILAGPSRTHRAHIIWSDLQLNRPDVGRVARHDHGTAAFAARELWPYGPRRVDVVDRRPG
jgi:hypothetical protein